MKAKVKRVQPTEFDFSTLGHYERTVYISGLLGSLISTISTQTLASVDDIIIFISAYVEDFDANEYLSKTKYCRQYIQSIINGDLSADRYKGEHPYDKHIF